MDTLSDILSLLRPQSYMSAGFDAGDPWCLRFGSFEGLKFNCVLSGSCWLEMEDGPGPVRLEAGDCSLLPKGRPFRLGSDLSAPAADAAEIFAAAPRGGIARYNGGGSFFLVGSRFMLNGPQADLLLGMLPPIVHVGGERGRETLRWSLERMRQELREPLPGKALVLEHLIHLMLVEALRLYLSDPASAGTGFLFALADKRLGAAIDLIHSEPGRRWTVGELAGRVGMSRTAFAVRFRQIVGLAPVEYLTRWRMLLAADRLRHSPDAIATIATSLGYESESAFGAAFKKWMGRSPRRYARDGAGGRDSQAFAISGESPGLPGSGDNRHRHPRD